MRQRGKITDEEMKRIAKLRSQGMSYNDIGRRMGRGAETIRVHYNRYYGIAIVKSVWIDDDLDKLRRMVAVRSPMDKMCTALGRSRHAVKRKVTELVEIVVRRALKPQTRRLPIACTPPPQRAHASFWRPMWIISQSTILTAKLSGGSQHDPAVTQDRAEDG